MTNPMARALMARFCEQVGDLTVVARAESGSAAIAACRSCGPDLLLLDSDLKDMSGFDVLHALEKPPLTIMVADRPQHAVEAFAQEAVACLLKPLSESRFVAAVARARQRRNFPAFVPEAGPDRGVPRLVGERGRRFYFLPADAIDYIEADGNYVRIHTGAEHYISRNTLKRLGDELTPFGYLRIGRSLLLNLARTIYAERAGRGEFAFVMRGGQRLESSRSFRQAILKELRFTQQAVRGGVANDLRYNAC